MTPPALAAIIAQVLNQTGPRELVAIAHGAEVWVYLWKPSPGLSMTIKSHHNTGGIPDYRFILSAATLPLLGWS